MVRVWPLHPQGCYWFLSPIGLEALFVTACRVSEDPSFRQKGLESDVAFTLGYILFKSSVNVIPNE